MRPGSAGSEEEVADSDGQLFLEENNQPPQVDAVEGGDPAQYDDDEDGPGERHAEQHLCKREQRADTILPDRESHCAEDGERSELHDDGGHAEEEVRRGAGEAQQPLTFIQHHQRDTHENGEEEDLQDVAVGEGTNEGVRQDVQEEATDGKGVAGMNVLLDGLGVQGAGIDVHACAGMQQMGEDEA